MAAIHPRADAHQRVHAAQEIIKDLERNSHQVWDT